jgi:hypothetical protein
LSAADWSTFNSKQNALTLTTTGTSGAATLVGSTLNIPNYGSALSGYLPLTGGTLTGPLISSFNTGAEPYVNATFSGVGGANIGGILTNGTAQAHVRFLVGSNTWDGAGAKQWQIRVGNGNSEDNLKIYSWTYGNDVATFLADATVRLHKYTTNGFVKFGSSNGTLEVDTNVYYLASNPSGFTSNTGTVTVTGSATTNYLPKFTGSTSIGDSNLINNTAGNLGLAVTPSSWSSGARAFQIGARMSLYNDGFNNALFANNMFFDGSNNIYINTGAVGRFYIENTGAFIWNQAPSGTAGTAVSFTVPMTLFASGNLLVGSGSDAGYKLDVNGTGRFSGAVTVNGDFVSNGGAAGTRFIITSAGAGDGLGVLYDANSVAKIQLFTNGVSYFNGGNLLVGTTTDAGFKLDVNGTGRFSEKITSSVGNNAQILTTQGATTGYQFLDIVNTSGRLVIAQEGSTAGTVFIGTTAYASAIGTAVSRDFQIGTNNTIRLTIAAATGAATFSNIVTAQGRIISGPGAFRNGGFYIPSSNANTGSRTWAMTNDEIEWGDFSIITSSTQTGDINTTRLYINSLGVTTINNLAGSGNRIVVANSGGTLISAVIGSGLAFDGTTLTATGGSSGSISGSGTSGTIALFTGSTSIGNSVITQSSGNVGIGVTPGSLLHISGANNDSSGTYFSQLRINGTGTYPNNITGLSFENGGVQQHIRFVESGVTKFQIRYNAGNTVDNRLKYYSFITNTDFVTFNANNGNVLIGTGTDNGNMLRVNGTIFSDSSVTATSFFESSDATLKTLVEDDYQAKGIDSVVAKLYIKNGKQELGYYAQDLQGVLPSAVSKGSDGLLNLSYREVHTAKIAYLEEEIRQIKKRYEIN